MSSVPIRQVVQVRLDAGQSLVPVELWLPEPRKHWDPMLPWFAALMRAARESRRLSRAEAGRRGQCSDETVRRLEALECEPAMDLSKRLCRGYELELGPIVSEAERLGG